MGTQSERFPRINHTTDGTLGRSHIPSTVCHAYFCSFSQICPHKKLRPSRVSMRECLRYKGTTQKTPYLSEFALDALAQRRVKGKLLTSVTLSILDEFRPNGPLRSDV